MTTRQFMELRRMNQAGLNDHIIAETLGIPQTTVWYNRNKLGLPVVKRKRHKRYTVYNGKTSEYLIEGTAKECADWLGLTREGFNSAFGLFRKGQYKKYEIYLVEEK